MIAPASPFGLGEVVAGCQLHAHDRVGPLWRYQAHDLELERGCEVLCLEAEHPQRAQLLQRVRQLARSELPGLQPIYRVREHPRATVLVAQSSRGTPLLTALRERSLPQALAWIDQALACVQLAQREQLAPPRLTEAVILDHRLSWPCTALLTADAAASVRPQLCALLAAVVERARVPRALLAVCEALDRDQFTDVAELRGALRAAQRSGWQRAGALAGLAGLALVALASWAGARGDGARPLAEVALAPMIRDDLPARVAQMRALAQAGVAVAHADGPDLAGAWISEARPDDAPVSLRATGAPARGQWRYASGVGLDGAPATWQHVGVLTLRRLAGRLFLVGAIDRTPAQIDDDSFAVLEFELVDADHLRLHSSVFHDPAGVGWSFAFFEQALVRSPLEPPVRSARQDQPAARRAAR